MRVVTKLVSKFGECGDFYQGGSVGGGERELEFGEVLEVQYFFFIRSFIFEVFVICG